MRVSIFLKKVDWVVLAEGVSCSFGVVGEDGCYLLGNAVFLCDVEIAH